MSIKVYLSPVEAGKNQVVQVINPSSHFEGDVHGLLTSINGGRNYGYEVIKETRNARD